MHVKFYISVLFIGISSFQLLLFNSLLFFIVFIPVQDNKLYYRNFETLMLDMIFVIPDQYMQIFNSHFSTFVLLNFLSF